VYYIHLCMLPRVVQGDQMMMMMGMIIVSSFSQLATRRGTMASQRVQKFLKTAYVIPPTYGRTGGVTVFRINVRNNGCWRTAIEGGA